MRRAVVLVTFLALWWLPRHIAMAGPPACDRTFTLEAVNCGGSDNTASAQRAPRRTSSTTPRPAPIYRAWLRTLPDGSQCYVMGWGRSSPAGTLDDQGVPLLNAPRCPPLDTEQAAAREFWETVPLPRPQPMIQPGEAIAGKDAFLEIAGDRAPRFTVPNPLGGPEIVVEATATFVVDWGDGTTTTTTSAGGPWPEGDVTHVWTDAGTYDVVVTASWTATWTAGQLEGTLDGLRTVGRIDDFPVRQVQAVRTR